jgi:hypothetical protein
MIVSPRRSLAAQKQRTAHISPLEHVMNDVERLVDLDEGGLDRHDTMHMFGTQVHVGFIGHVRETVTEIERIDLTHYFQQPNPARGQGLQRSSLITCANLSRQRGQESIDLALTSAGASQAVRGALWIRTRKVLLWIGSALLRTT